MWTPVQSSGTCRRARCPDDQEASDAVPEPRPTCRRRRAGQVRARALDLLDEIAADGPGTQLQLSTRLGIPKSSLHALLRTMTDRGWLQTDPTGSVYQLGIHSLVVSSAYLAGDPVSRAPPRYGRDRGGHGGDRQPRPARRRRVIYTAKRESVHPLRMHSPVGRRLPAYSTALGRAILAEHPVSARPWSPTHRRRSPRRR